MYDLVVRTAPISSPKEITFKGALLAKLIPMQILKPA